jgi:hypothetical protein
MLGLHRRNSGNVSEKLYDSLYMGNPFGEPLLGLCFDGGKLVGQENYIRQDIALNGNIYKAALGINTMVDGNYRILRGVFQELVKLTMREMKENTDILCAYANEESKKYYLKYFQWEVSSKVQVFKKSIGYSGFSRESFLALVKPGRLEKDFRLKEVKDFNSTVLRKIIERHKKEAKYAYFYKTAAFLNWKYLGNKHYRLTGYDIEYREVPCGYVVTYEDGIELKVVDFLIDNDDVEVFEKLISALSYFGSQMGKKRIVIYASPDCWYLNSLKKNFFIHRWDFDFITANLNHAPIGKESVIQIGDFDIF